MTEVKWYVRDRGAIRGPFSEDQLLQLHRRGQLARFHDISQDRASWSKASSFLDRVAPPSATLPAASAGPRVAEAPLQTPMTDSQAWPVIADDASLAGDRPRPKLTGGRMKSAVLAIAALALVIVSGIAFLAFLASRGAVPRLRFPSMADQAADTIRSSEAEAEIAASVGLVIVGVDYARPDGTHGEMPLSTGSCFAITEDGVLLTNRHVVKTFDQMENADGITNRRKLYVDEVLADIPEKKRADLLSKDPEELRFSRLEPKIWVFFIGRNSRPEKRTARILFLSDESESDLAILKVDRSKTDSRKIPYFRLASSDQKLPRGEHVVALGFPGTSRHAVSIEEQVEEQLRRKLATRVESIFKDRDFAYSRDSGEVTRDYNEKNGRRWIQHNAAITHGNSGGPLINPKGLVVGINTRGEQDGSTFQALSIAQLRDLIEEHAKESVFSED